MTNAKFPKVLFFVNGLDYALMKIMIKNTTKLTDFLA